MNFYHCELTQIPYIEIEKSINTHVPNAPDKLIVAWQLLFNFLDTRKLCWVPVVILSHSMCFLNVSITFPNYSASQANM